MNSTYSWYQTIKKPSFAPPAWLFGPVWTVLYVLILLSYGYVFYLGFKKRLPFIVVLPFIINLVTNLIYSPIQFGLHNFLLATVDISLVLVTLVWEMFAIYPYAKIVAYVQIPYLFWVLFATILQYSVTWLNR